MAILNTFDEYREALKKVHLDEGIMVLKRGRLVENMDAYNKIQKMLACPDMENCHRYLYSLDVDNLAESDERKVNKLFELAKERCMIEADDDEEEGEEKQDGEENQEETNEAIPASDTQEVIQPTVRTVTSQAIPERQSAFTCLYSATKDGEIKTGEYYSNAIQTRAAKSECIANLMKLGFDNIKIIAIEAGDPDLAGSEDTAVAGQNNMTQASLPANTDAEVVGEAEEGDGEEEKSEEELKFEAEEDAAIADKADAEAEDEETETEPDTSDENGELSAEKKGELKAAYTKLFKSTMIKLKFEKSLDELSLKDRAKFWDAFAEEWDDVDPSEFMTDKEQANLQKLVVKA